MTLNYEWIEKSEYEANILKPNSEIEKQDYKLAYVDGATAYKQAVEKKIKDQIAKYERLYQLARKEENLTDAGIYYELEASYKNFLLDLQTLTPTSND
jgi:hypothetical protein